MAEHELRAETHSPRAAVSGSRGLCARTPCALRQPWASRRIPSSPCISLPAPREVRGRYTSAQNVHSLRPRREQNEHNLTGLPAAIVPGGSTQATLQGGSKLVRSRGRRGRAPSFPSASDTRRASPEQGHKERGLEQSEVQRVNKNTFRGRRPQTTHRKRCGAGNLRGPSSALLRRRLPHSLRTKVESDSARDAEASRKRTAGSAWRIQWEMQRGHEGGQSIVRLSPAAPGVPGGGRALSRAVAWSADTTLAASRRPAP